MNKANVAKSFQHLSQKLTCFQCNIAINIAIISYTIYLRLITTFLCHFKQSETLQERFLCILHGYGSFSFCVLLRQEIRARK